MRATIFMLLCFAWLTSAARGQVCAGDCNGGGSVTIDELIAAVTWALAGRMTSPRPDRQLYTGAAVAISATDVIAVGAYGTPGRDGALEAGAALIFE